MSSNTHFAIGVHLLTSLSLAGDQWASSTQLTFSINTNPAFLRAVTGKLRRAGLVVSKAGRNGGLKLTRSAAEISLLDVYRAFDGQAQLAVHDCSRTQCVLGQRIPSLLEAVRKSVDSAVAAELAKVTVADIAAQGLAGVEVKEMNPTNTTKHGGGARDA